MFRLRPVTCVVSSCISSFGVIENSKRFTTSLSGSSSESATATYLPWNARPWRVTYELKAAELNHLDHDMCAIISDDCAAMYKFFSSTFGDGKDVNDYVEDPVKSLQNRQRKRQPGAAAPVGNKKVARATRRGHPETYMYMV